MRNFLLLSFSFLFSATLFAQGICSEAGNIIIFSNYDGGELNINIDEDIANIQIGICSYESIEINISGTYAENVTKVLYAGYDSGLSTSVTGVDDAIVDIELYPLSTLDDPDGNEYIVCAYECDTDFIPGGCNTVDQVTDYFLTELEGSLRFSYLQYGIFGTGTYDMSEGGNCCFGEADCILTVNSGFDQEICSGETVTITATGAETYIWTPTVTCDPPCATITINPTSTTTYFVTGTDDDGCFGTDEITITVNATPEALITEIDNSLFADGGGTYQWLLNGEIITGETGTFYTPTVSGNYSFVATSAEGCSDTSDVITVVVQSVADALFGAGIVLFPNPATDHLNISLFNNLSGQYHFTILNNVGETLKTMSFTKTLNTDEFMIPISEFANGTYTLLIKTNTSFSAKQFMIVKE
ncbi:MAG: T9SS type A sorting domain-containing protein [Fimbriimonadaceae bacterium]|nr:T9SS type A sorting domain-containing protein [Chitinophagales bacterium]